MRGKHESPSADGVADASDPTDAAQPLPSEPNTSNHELSLVMPPTRSPTSSLEAGLTPTNNGNDDAILVQRPSKLPVSTAQELEPQSATLQKRPTFS